MYKIKLPNFEGPFDLLLYFIKRDELDIYDIPIARITEEFLNYIRIIKLFDLELAAEFLGMASTLILIKTQMLLPRVSDNDEGEIEDPRNQLVQRLLEYKKYKEAALQIAELANDQQYIFYRQLFDYDINFINEHAIDTYSNATVFDLVKCLRNILIRSQNKPISHIVGLFTITIEDQKKLILNELLNKKRILFSYITKSYIRIDIIITFLAILDLIKLNKISISQNDNFEDITIYHIPKTLLL